MELEKQYNEKQLILLEYEGQLVYEKSKLEKLLTDNEANRQWIEDHYTRKIELLCKIIKELED